MARAVAQGLFADALHPVRHLRGGAARKRHQQNAVRVCAVGDEMCHPMSEGVGFTGACPGDDQKRRGHGRPALDHAVFDRLSLVQIEAIE